MTSGVSYIVLIIYVHSLFPESHYIAVFCLQMLDPIMMVYLYRLALHGVGLYLMKCFKGITGSHLESSPYTMYHHRKSPASSIDEA